MAVSSVPPLAVGYRPIGALRPDPRHARTHPKQQIDPIVASIPEFGPRKQTARSNTTRSAFEIVFEKRLTITQGGVDRELSVQEALQLRTYQNALAGNRMAQREVLKMIAKREKAIGSGHRTLPPV